MEIYTEECERERVEKTEGELGKTKPQIRTQTHEVDSVISGYGKRGALPGLTLPHVALLPPSLSLTLSLS